MPMSAPTPITMTALIPAISALINARPIETGSSDDGVAKM
jgi:hypothetical protein